MKFIIRRKSTCQNLHGINEGERLFETGVSEVALYPFQTNGYTKGVAWNGVKFYYRQSWRSRVK